MLIALGYGGKAFSISWVIKAPQWANQTLALYRCVGGDLLLIDSLQLSPRGRGEVTIDPSLEAGMYFVKYRHWKYDFLVENPETMYLRIDTSQTYALCKIKGPSATRQFNRYKHYLQQQKARKEHASWTDQEKIDREVDRYQQQLIAANKGSYLADLLQLIRFFAGAESSYSTDDSWLLDRRLWNTTYLPIKIRQELRQCGDHHPQLLIPVCDSLLAKVAGDTLIHSYLLEQILSFASGYTLVDGENLRAHLLENYADTSPVWQKWYPFYQEEYERTRHCRLGQKAHNLLLRGCDGEQFEALASSPPLKLLIFYDSDCVHCQQRMPDYLRLYRQYREKGLDVIAVYIGFEKETWCDFIEKQQCKDWKNGFVLEDSPYFWQDYDISHTPSVYLLDEENRIIAKQCDLATLEEIIKKRVK